MPPVVCKSLLDANQLTFLSSFLSPVQILDNAATPSTTCLTCKKDCRHVQGLLSHVKSTGHESGMALCDACGRVSPA
jgi:hypothetical protein